MTVLMLKVAGIWCIMVLCAILNGLLRENILNPWLGNDIALPVSGLILSLLVLLVTWLFIPLFGIQQPRIYWLIGGLWISMTLAFEFLFGRFVVGNSWQDIFQVFNITQGNLFLLALLVTAIAPWLMARSRGLI